MKSHRTLSRRELLGGAAAAAALSPLIPLLESHAQGRKPPLRFVVFHVPNGITSTFDRWRPQGSESAFTMGESLNTLEPWKQDLVVLDGLHGAANGKNPSEHSIGANEMLTGWAAVRPGDKASTRANGISVDQQIAKTIGTGTAFQSVQLGVRTEVDENDNQLGGAAIVYSGPSQPVVCDSNPYAVFDRMFGGFSVPPPGTGTPPPVAGPPQRDLDRRSIIDFALADLARVRTRVSAADRIKMDQHETALRAIEKTLAAPAGGGGGPGGGAPTSMPGAGCTLPVKGTPVNWKSDDAIPVVGKLQIDLLVAGLACDRSRVFSLQWGGTGWNARLRFLGYSSDSHHDFNHHDLPDGTVKAHQWIGSQLAYMLGKMSAIKESDGTSLLYNTLILWISEFGDGVVHSNAYIPMMLLGQAGGAIKTGRYLKLAGQPPHSNALLSLCHAFGQTNLTSFGDPKLCKGPIAGLVG